MKSLTSTNSDFFFLTRFVAAYVLMPETEHRSLEDIEFHYSDDSKPFTDIDIRPKLRPEPRQ